jgi:hypothetical protein
MTTPIYPPELPVAVSTTFSVAANAENGPSRLSDLINKYRMPMWVDEIRIASTATTGGTSFYDIMTQTNIRILFGKYAITHEFVPGTVLAPLWPGAGQIVIKLAKPLYITPQDLPVPTVRSATSLTVVFTLVGRLAAPLPLGSKIWVPYVSAFAGTSTAAGQTSSQQSNRVDLANPFRVPFIAKYFLGYRTVDPLTDSVTSGTVNSGPPINVRLSDSRGRPIVRDPTPFYDLFNIRDQAWAVNALLPPGGYFIANVDVDATDALSAQNFRIAMFGYREEAVQWSI